LVSGISVTTGVAVLAVADGAVAVAATGTAGVAAESAAARFWREAEFWLAVATVPVAVALAIWRPNKLFPLEVLAAA
jgi:hypothetical protein